MTHDELLEMVNFEVEVAELRYLEQGLPFAKALRAVVELHKPEHSIRGYRCNVDDELYPCAEIQAIQKELE